MLRLRDSGISYSAVASKLGLSRAVQAHEIFIRALRGRPDDEREELTLREAGRLDTLEARVRSRDAAEPVKMERRLKALERLRDAIKQPD